MCNSKKILFLATFIQLLILSCHADNLSESVSKLTHDIDAAATIENFSGAILLVKDDALLLKKSWGLSCRRYGIENNLDTKFNLASIGKLFTSVAIAQLVQDGKLNLNDPINKYLNGWLSSDIAKQITVRDLLIHASGLGNFFDNSKFKLGDASGLFLTIKDYKPIAVEEKLIFEPGFSQLYSNTGYLLLGALIETITGIDYFEYIRQHIFIPAQMSDSGFYEMDDPVPNLAIGFGRYESEGKKYWKNNLFTNVFKGSPAGGAFSTLQDMGKFAQALIKGKLLNSEFTKKILSGEVAKPSNLKGYYYKTIEIQGQFFEALFSPYGFAGEWNEFGFAIINKDPLSVGHDGGGMRGINDFFAIYPDQEAILMIFSNYTGKGIIDPRQQFIDVINGKVDLAK